MRTYEKKSIEENNIAKASDINTKTSNYYSQLNGTLGQNNLPLDSVDITHLDNPTRTALTTQTNTVMPTQAFYVTEGCLPGTKTNGVMDPRTTYEYDDTDFVVGWISLLPRLGTADGVYLSFQSQAGMLKGNATIDIGRLLGTEYSVDGQGNVTFNPIGEEWRLQIGVFVNNVLVAETDNIPSRRGTICLPYSIPIDAVWCEVEIKFKATKQVHTLMPNVIAPGVSVYSSELWCRNQYR